MINFKVVRWKNFLSTGNIFTEVQLNKTANTLIVGENGAGKSTILDAITFALFGKAFRKINKPALINSVNEKNCLVEIEFETNGKSYKIVRGIKPNVFEIYMNDTMINQDSASKDYQEYLESTIIKMNYKSFTQIVILGSASFTPFMQLSTNDRRTVIEDLLDIQIFSTMNVIVKQKLQSNKEQLERNRIEITAKEDNKAYIEKTLASLKTNNDEKLRELEQQKEHYNEEKKKLLTRVETIAKERDELITKIANLSELRKQHTDFVKLQAKRDSDMKRCDKEKDFYNHSDNCPTCKQKIDESFKTQRIKELSIEIDATLKHLALDDVTISTLVDSISNMENLAKKIDSITSEIKTSKNTMMHFVSMINETEDAIDKLLHSDKLINDSKEELVNVTQDLITLNYRKEELLNERQYIETALVLLKDGGIKTKIIKQYLPIINKLINKYLSQMGFFVNFNINEQFEETIKSRYRDEFSYQNFSEGEKMRIDLALLFTWRAIAKMRNSVNTNLLLLDEVFDGSLDMNGTDEFLKIMWSMLSDTNTFVISHKTDQLTDRFQRTLRFEKHKNFSRIVT